MLQKADLWRCGVMIYRMALGHYPDGCAIDVGPVLQVMLGLLVDVPVACRKGFISPSAFNATSCSQLPAATRLH